MGKVLVLYVFHMYNDRVQHFIDNCIFYDSNVDFMVISNNKDHVIPLPDYVSTLYRDNIGYDFGGWSDGLIMNDVYKKYDHFIFINSSVQGPFMSSKGKWTDIYVNGLQNNVKLFGSTINTCGNPLRFSHVQSYVFSMDKTTLEYLMDCEIFTTKHYVKTMNDAIWCKEVLMSRKILENNWNIGSLMKYYSGVDFTFKDKSPTEYNIKFLNDIMWNGYRNVLWNEYELVFIKGNRDILINKI